MLAFISEQWIPIINKEAMNEERSSAEVAENKKDKEKFPHTIWKKKLQINEFDSIRNATQKTFLHLILLTDDWY